MNDPIGGQHVQTPDGSGVIDYFDATHELVIVRLPGQKDLQAYDIDDVTITCVEHGKPGCAYDDCSYRSPFEPHA